MAPRRAAVLGSPIAHSRSPLLHRAAYAALGLDWTYEAIDVTPEQLASVLAGCSWPEWAGLSLTMPLKTDVLPLLDEVSSLAVRVQAANTVVFTESGAHGHNTDVAGMQRALGEAGGSGHRTDSAVVIGSGATARSAIAALGGLGTRSISVIARSPQRAADLRPCAEDFGVDLTVVDWSHAPALESDVVISTVPPGAADKFAERVPERPGVLLDVAYGDSPTALARAWAGAGGPVADGLDLLLWQAVDQVQLMTGLDAPVDAMRAAVREPVRDGWADPAGRPDGPDA
ncbi:MAG: shikimate dehydrogenase [Candidatus Nanopelagicales bacterium]